MSVRTRTLITIGATLLGLIIILFIGTSTMLVRSFAQFEEQRTRIEVRRADSALHQEIHNLGSLAGAWAACGGFGAKSLTLGSFPWLNSATLADHRTNIVLCYNNAQQLALTREYIDGRRSLQPLNSATAQFYQRQARRLCQIGRRSGIEGVLTSPNGPVLFAARSVFSATDRRTITATLVLGRYLDSATIIELGQTNRLQLDLFPESQQMPDDVRRALKELSSDRPYQVNPVSAANIAGYLLINDLNHHPVGVLRVQQPRSLYNRSWQGVRYIMISLLLIGLVISVLAIMLLEKQVLAPLAHLSAYVTHIGESGDLAARLPVKGRDELACLASSLNQMLTALETSQEELRKKEALRESEERYRTLVELSPDAVFLVRDGNFVFANAAGVDLLGASEPEDLLDQPFLGALHPEHQDLLQRHLQYLSDGQHTPSEERFVRLDGTVIEVELLAVPFTYQDQPATQIVVRDITERKRDRERLNYLAYFDPLTGLPNRQLFNDRLKQALALAHRRKEHVTVMVLDLDRFKEINDTLGHHVGDRLLQAVATRLKDCMRESDTISHIGGDEFFLLLPNTNGSHNAETVARKVINSFAEPIIVDSHELYITASLGICSYPDDGANVEVLVKNADMAMYRAKAAGRNSFALYSPEMGALVTERRSMENKLRKALDRGELTVYYQPKVDLRTGRVTGMEALARWPSPELGMVPPMLFIPMAEETGLIEPIGEFVLRAACAQNRVFQLSGCPRLQVAVNLSVVQFQQTTLIETVKRILQETTLPPHLLELEITESVAMQNIDHTLSVLRSLDELGVSIAIDDFGTGYSSFSYLTKFPVHTLKIDRSFIQDLLYDEDDTAIVSAIIAMTHSLRRRVVAEAVETEVQAQFLREHDCDEAQGYLFGKPVPPEEFIQLADRINGTLVA